MTKKLLYSISQSNIIKIAFGSFLAVTLVKSYELFQKNENMKNQILPDQREELFASTSTNSPASKSFTKISLEEVKSESHRIFNESRTRIHQYCKKYENDTILKEVNEDSKWNKDLWFDYEYRLIFCQISKVSSSTWITSLMR